jgi:PAS domain S-box-containing protein
MAEFEYDPADADGNFRALESIGGPPEELLAAARHLELALQDAPLAEILESLVRIVEVQSAGGVLGSILLLDDDGRHLRHGSAPSLPDAYNEAIDGVEIGPSVGSCGTAAHRGEPVFVTDIQADPLWVNFRDLALEHGLGACWSIPIRSSHGRILGTFAMYYREPREPSPHDLDLVDFITRTAALAIERKRGEDALKFGEQRFRTVFENAGVGMLEMDSEWRILGVNQVYADITGRTEADLIGVDCLSFTHVDDLERSREAMGRIVDGSSDRLSFEKRYLKPDGEIVWIRSNLARVSSGNEGDRYLKIVEDITDAKAAEQALEEERRTLETLNRVGSSLAGELDLERVVQMVTDAGVELTGAEFGAFFYNVTDDQGESYMLYTLTGADREEFEKFGMPRNTKVFAPTFGGEGIVRSDDITKDERYGQNPPHHGMPKGHLPVVSYLAVPVVGRTDEVIGGLFFGHHDRGRFKERHERLMAGIAAQAAIAIDNARLFREAQREIDQRMKAEQALTALNETLESRVGEEIGRRSEAEEALRQAQKMETVGQLSGGIAHDFNNLLQIIHGNLSILEQSLPDDQVKWQRSVGNALKGAERAAALTQRLLAFSRRQPLDARPIDVNRLIADMSELLHRTIGETVTVRTILKPGLRLASVDRNQLENAILNLAINARDAMPNGGQLIVETSDVEIDEAYVRKNPEATPGRYIRVRVKDSGHGMDPRTLARAVEPFFTTKEVGKGTGLGLSMVYGFVKQSGGHISLHSEVDSGTTADIYLPRAAESALQSDAGLQPNKVPRGRGETILVCEDDEDVRRFTVETLADLGYTVIESQEATSAIAALIKASRIDLLFTDVVLPGGRTGADLARDARKIQPDLKVLFTTGYARSALDDSSGERTLELITKPFGVGDLARRLRKLLD